MRPRTAITAAAGLLIGIGAAPAQQPLDDVSFLANFRELKGRTVTVDSCVVAGTTSQWIRCESRNGAGSYSLDAATMNRDDLRTALTTCPTGSRLKPQCRFLVTGTIAESDLPSLKNARFERLP